VSRAAAGAAGVFTFCCAIGLRNTLRTGSSIRWIEAADPTALEQPTPALRFVILVPLLREQPVVERLLRRMAALDGRAAADSRIAFVTTSREDGDGDVFSTAQVLTRALREHPDPRFVHLHCDTGTDRCKADQLNFAMGQLGLAGGRARDLFVGVYDGDSAPEPATLTHIVARVRETPELKAIQQVPLYFQNLRNPSTLRELYLMCRPLHNALFALTVEVPCMRRQAGVFASPRRSPRRVLGAWLSHGLGHGQFFRLDILTDMRAFQPPSCDTQLGHGLAFCGVPIQAHPMLDVGETPESVSVLMRQGVVWFNSMNTFWRTKRHVDELTGGAYHRPAAWAMIVRLMHSNLAWAAYPPVFLAAQAWALATGRRLLAAYGALAWLVYVAPVALILSRHDLWARRSSEPISELSPASRVAIVLMFGAEKLGSCISPYLWCAHALRSALAGKPIPLDKTARAGAG
jgi:hypothetical protein